MQRREWNRNLAIFGCGAVIGVLSYCILTGNDWSTGRAAFAQDPQLDSTAEFVALQRDLALLNGKVPSQSHAMMDVGYHYTNLWFAARAENWPLAEFYWNETLSHLRWAVRIIPIRKDNAGQEIKLQDILQAVENSAMTPLKEAIDVKDATKFEAAYRLTLESCYACHKAADKPYLRLQIPEQPATSIINFDPDAAWPR